ncbi:MULTISPECIES: hypothetical protein [unclassified Pantoea]|uniref:hypothetical protein n=1 Tax=unclassified Pantoea TaxID=2630326 RepID=UPI001CD55AE3|nr:MULTISPECIES: hypothetical protein [unclassified Pantoea]MCA1175451.1 hypothetical protein [Pantoea sp. alder69]MCA1251428.1 hypothetical protein [Pantoea sp. alder70]MCA1263632.1 hypothetical protein [Pantoea sp. alder81]
MERFSQNQYVSGSVMRAEHQKRLPSELPFRCYWLQSVNASHRFELVNTDPGAFEKLNEDDFLLFAPAGFTPAAALLLEVAKCSDQRPELNCFIQPLSSQHLITTGLQSSLQLFQQLQAGQQWCQHYVIIIRVALISAAVPLQRVQDVMLAGLINTESVWVLDALNSGSESTESTALTYQQFMQEYEKLTRMTHYLPERNHYRKSYLRGGLLNLIQQDLKQADKLSDNVRHAIHYFSEQFPAQGVMEKLMLKQPDIYFNLMKVRKTSVA